MGKAKMKNNDKHDRFREVCGSCKDERKMAEIQCDACCTWFHLNCQKKAIHPKIYELHTMFNTLETDYPDQIRFTKLTWFCGDCFEEDKKNKEINAGILNSVKMLSSQISKIEEKLQLQESLPTYAQKVLMDKPVESEKYFPRLTITAKNREDNMNILKEIHSATKNKNIKLNKVFMNKNDKSVKIECRSSVDCEEVQRLIDRNKFQVKQPKMLYPRIKVVNILSECVENLTDEEIIDDICTKNDLKADSIKIIKRYSNCRGQSQLFSETKWTLVLECSPFTAQILKNKNSCYIGFMACKVFDALNVRQCGKCWSFAHGSNNCESEKLCMKCQIKRL